MLRSRLVVVACVVSILPPSLVVAQDAGRLTSASNARLRSDPGESGAVVATLPLGTALVGIETGGADRDWLRVRTADGREGWILSRLTRRFDASRRLDVIASIVDDRLARQGDSFAARAEIVALLERSLPDVGDAERAGQFAWRWAKALAHAAAALPRSYEPGDSYNAWIAAHEVMLSWNEVAASWTLSNDGLRDLHQRHRDTSAADAIAWLAVEIGLGGECEGYLPCAVTRSDRLEGGYLRQHPNGRRAGDAVGRIGESATLWLSQSTRPDAFSADKDCGALTTSLTPLRAAVASTTAATRDQTLARLDQLGRRCTAASVDETSSPTAGEAAMSSAVTREPSAGPRPASPAALAVPPAPAESARGGRTLWAIAAALLVGIITIVAWRRRAASPAGRIGFS